MYSSLSRYSPYQKGHRRRIAFFFLRKARKLFIKFGLFSLALFGFSLTFAMRFGVAFSLDVLGLTDALLSGLMRAYQGVIAIIQSIVI